jgi:4-hydroxythreonine-4-phosphate dehydrogenase
LAAVPAIALTVGEPAGIGPEIALAIAAEQWPCRVVAVGDPDLLAERAAAVGSSVRIVADDGSCDAHQPGILPVAGGSLDGRAEPGQLNPAHARRVLDWLEHAAEGCLSGRYAAMVTCPLHKGVINEAGIPFTGHTEFLAGLTGGRPVMMLAAGALRVALVTTHLPLSSVPGAITGEAVTRTVTTVHSELAGRFGIAGPRLLLAGLNPHAGEGGHLGREELEIIEPAAERLRAAGIDVAGPLPADTLFTPKKLSEADAVVCMYHDQGLPVLKALGFGEAVNITLGLPIIRTSVDHGTALDLAGTGRADPGSLRAALGQAIALCRQ